MRYKARRIDGFAELWGFHHSGILGTMCSSSTMFLAVLQYTLSTVVATHQCLCDTSTLVAYCSALHVQQDDDSWLGADQKTSTRFDRHFSISDWLKINLGTELGLPLVR